MRIRGATAVICVCIGTAFSSGKRNAKAISVEQVLELGGNGTFIRVEEVTFDSKDDIFVTDSYQYSVKKFSRRGSSLQEFGKRGSKPDEFKSFPYKLACQSDTLALVEVGSSTVHFFTPEFKLIGEMSADGPIVDVTFNNKGQVYACMIPFSHRKEDVVALYDKSGALLSRVVLTKARGEPAFDMMHLIVDSNNNLLVAYRYINTVSIYDAGQRITSSFKIAGLPDESPSEKSKYAELGSLPAGDIIRDIAVDQHGNIFLLAGDYSNAPDRDVFVYDYGGNLLTSFTLPDQTGILAIDRRGFMYTREKKRSVVKKYRLRYSNF